MNITLTPEHEKLVVSQIESGRLRNAETVVTSELNSQMEDVLRDAPGERAKIVSPSFSCAITTNDRQIGYP